MPKKTPDKSRGSLIDVIETEHEHELQGNFYNEFVERFLAKYQSEFPPISVVKMLRRYGRRHEPTGEGL
jgi:hypothetical protein